VTYTTSDIVVSGGRKLTVASGQSSSGKVLSGGTVIVNSGMAGRDR
jgi:hypothetical protein